ncbi:hypothetical protein CC78DRAFT_96668 [Lojkania enalia]|uniref:Uncharacterized protein n=1 Tax=Lojkania enalia TaxID=147567 RepID=A0A9P4JYG3_9PLEO|nr:hypothetical protein CC78DRAFT_96668 [Didymosphaeria enalia]
MELAKRAGFIILEIVLFRRLRSLDYCRRRVRDAVQPSLLFIEPVCAPARPTPVLPSSDHAFNLIKSRSNISHTNTSAV